MWTEVKIEREEQSRASQIGRVVVVASTLFFVLCLSNAVMSVMEGVSQLGPLHGQ